MNESDLNDVLDKFYEALNERNGDRLKTFFTNDARYVDTDLKIADLTIRTKEAVARKLVVNMSKYSQFRIEIEKVSITGNKATVKWTLQGLFRPQGFVMRKFSGIDTFSFDNNGKIDHLSSMWNSSEHSYGTIKPVYGEK